MSETHGLLLMLAGPMQSWGERGRFGDRDSLGFPTRSGVVGLLASALGRERGASLADLEDLAVTVRVDRPGAISRDFQTVGGGMGREGAVPTASGTYRPEGKGTVISHRYYLADAAFIVAIDGPAALVGTLASALTHPVFAPFLGRRGYQPHQPLLLGVGPRPAAPSLAGFPLLRWAPRGDAATVEFVGEENDDTRPRTSVMDRPLGFDPLHRRYAERDTYRWEVEVPADRCVGQGPAATEQLVEEVAQWARG